MKFTGFWALMSLDMVLVIFLAFWWITGGWDSLRDLLAIGIFTVMNIIIFKTQKK